MNAVYAFIEVMKTTRGVALLCRVLKVTMTSSSYYAWHTARPAVAKRQTDEEALAEEIRQIHADSGGANGAPQCTPPCVGKVWWSTE